MAALLWSLVQTQLQVLRLFIDSCPKVFQATVLSHILFFLATHDGPYRRLQKEIEDTYKAAGDTVDPSKLAHLPYLNAVMYVLRRFYILILNEYQQQRNPSSVPCCPEWQSKRAAPGKRWRCYDWPIVRQSRSGRDSVTVTDRESSHVPEGTAVQMHFYTMQRDERNFAPLPDAFIPDRWLVESERSVNCPKIVTHNQTAFVPFSYGPAVRIPLSFLYSDQAVYLSCPLEMRRKEPCFGRIAGGHCLNCTEVWLPTRRRFQGAGLSG